MTQHTHCSMCNLAHEFDPVKNLSQVVVPAWDCPSCGNHTDVWRTYDIAGLAARMDRQEVLAHFRRSWGYEPPA